MRRQRFGEHRSLRNIREERVYSPHCRVFLFLQTDDFWKDFHAMRGKGVRFKENPRQESYGTVAVFEDLYGNLWDLVQLTRVTQA